MVESTFAHCSMFTSIEISDVMENKKNVWMKLHHLGLCLSTSEALYGFTPDELNEHHLHPSFRKPREITSHNLLPILNNGYTFQSLSTNKAIMAVSHFKSQAKKDDGRLPQ